MAAPVDFEGANMIMAAPPGQEDTVVDLPVFKHERGMTFAVMLDEDERAKVAETGIVWVFIMSHSMPPVAIGAHPEHHMIDPDGTTRPPRVVPLPIRNRRSKENG